MIATLPSVLLAIPLLVPAVEVATGISGLAQLAPGAPDASGALRESVANSFVLPAGLEWLSVALGYLLGSIPFGWLLARMRGIDLHKVGSGNIGATNTGRALGRPLGLLAFFLDFAKGWAPAALIAPAFAEASDPSRVATLAALSGAAAAVGHCFPIWLRLRGGKAVATWCGAIVAADPMVFLLGGVVWLVALFTVRYVGLASMLMSAAFPLAFGWRAGFQDPWVGVAAFMAVLIAIRHRTNIARMLSGSEPRFGAKKQEKTDV